MWLSLLDRARTRVGEADAAALTGTVDRAVGAERLGFARFWVAEHHGSATIAGRAPEVLMGTKVNGALTRPHCAWPNVARYRGTGDANDPASWQCIPRA